MKAKQLTMPMFPLNMMLLPRETTKLHIFEERYQHLVTDCLENDASFGIPFLEKGKVSRYGAEVKIKNVLKAYDNGAMDIVVECTNLFRLVEYSKVLKPKLYGAGVIEYIPAQKILLNNLQDATVSYFSTIQNKLIDYETVSGLTVYNVASALQLTNSEKYRLIAAPNQQLHLLGLLKFIIHIINTEQQIKDKFINN